MIKLTVNGRAVSIDASPDTPLLWAIREEVGLQGTKFGCGIAQCGTCTVHVDGEAIRSCTVALGDVAGRSITTIEGLSSERGRKLQAAFIEHQVPQCGYCQTGMIMAAAALLETTPKPTDADIDAAVTNLCRCGTYVRVRAAIHAAAAA